MAPLQKSLLTLVLVTTMVGVGVGQEVPGLAYMEILKTAPRGEDETSSVTSDAHEVSTRYDVMLNYDFYPLEDQSREHDFQDDPFDDETDESPVATAIERPPATEATPLVVSSGEIENESVAKTEYLSGVYPTEGKASSPTPNQAEILVIATSRSSEGELFQPPPVSVGVAQSKHESVQYKETVLSAPSDASVETQTLHEISLTGVDQESPRLLTHGASYSDNYPSYVHGSASGRHPNQQYPYDGKAGTYYPLEGYSPYYPSTSYLNQYDFPQYASTAYQPQYYPTGAHPAYSIHRAGYINPYGTVGYSANVRPEYYYPLRGNPSERNNPQTSEEKTLISQGLTDEADPYYLMHSPPRHESQIYRDTDTREEDSAEILPSIASQLQSASVPNYYSARTRSTQTSQPQKLIYKARAKDETQYRPRTSRAKPQIHKKTQDESNRPRSSAGTDKKDLDAVRYYTGLQMEIERSELLSDAIKDVRLREGKSVKAKRRTPSQNTPPPAPDMSEVKKNFGTHPLYQNLPISSSPTIEAGPIVLKEEYEDEDDEYDNLYLPVRAKSLELEEIREVKDHFNVLVPKVAYKAPSFLERPSYPGQGVYIPPVTTFRPYEIPKYNKELKSPASPGQRYSTRSPFARPSNKDRSHHPQRPNDSGKTQGSRPIDHKPYYTSRPKTYTFTTVRPYFSPTSKPKDPLHLPAAIPRPTSPPYSSNASLRPKVVATSRPKESPRVTFKSKSKDSGAAPYLRLTSTTRPRENRFAKSINLPSFQRNLHDPPKSESFSSSSEDGAKNQERGFARVPSSILQAQHQGPVVLKEKIREKRRHDLETQIDASIKFPKYGYNIDHYFLDFPAFGYFDFDHVAP